ncbi:hypothetical protein [Nostoc sp. MG11]|uniref:hypothetical protein n=1 Tax=Nostoc sp. MG11 TaxID=2721166 RepID=UPI0039B6FF1A
MIATACSKAPTGNTRWTLRLLADRIVSLGIVDSISYETVRRTLKKTHYPKIRVPLHTKTRKLVKSS